jgi:protein-S-isoprenylcysteine O-methyltransferase Ste14
MPAGILKLLIFIIISCCLWYISRASVRVVGSHGFYRFFAWEAITALILLNIDRWFIHPFSVLHIISWTLLLLSLVLLWNGYTMIRSKGKADEQRQDSTLYALEKTSVLVTSGVYKYIRHPLYGSLLFLAWGVFLKDVSWLTLCLAAGATGCLVLTAKADEAECIRYFGPSYKEYMSQTNMFIPFIY